MKNKYIIFSAMGFELVGLILGAVWMGQYLETLYSLKGLWIIILMVACLAGWLIQLIYLAKKLDKAVDPNPPLQ